ncbi:hypothetical protein AB0M94_28625 [Streptomyces xanthochromogenes]|uniref:hypothetical protein n=1 Tax=Streptomyces xanthochromogenes TaxID=67384 RepID=UPI003439039C
MKNIVAGHVPVTATEFVELALGTPIELWLGVQGESEMERAARLDAAHDILADYPDLPNQVSRVAAEAIETFAPDLFNVIPLPSATARRRRPRRSGAAA